MTKEDVLGHLEDAKTAHTRWVNRAKILINGLSIEEKAIPIKATECKFGQWLYTEGQILSGLSNNPIECMQNIEKLHSDLHDTYLKIFNIYFSQEKKTGFFSSLFGKKKKEVSELEKEFSMSEYEKIEKISEKLLDEINRLERRLGAVSEEKISSLV